MDLAAFATAATHVIGAPPGKNAYPELLPEARLAALKDTACHFVSGQRGDWFNGTIEGIGDETHPLVISVRPKLLVHADGGDSGGPLYVDRDGRLYLVGLLLGSRNVLEGGGGPVHPRWLYLHPGRALAAMRTIAWT